MPSRRRAADASILKKLRSGKADVRSAGTFSERRRAAAALAASSKPPAAITSTAVKASLEALRRAVVWKEEKRHYLEIRRGRRKGQFEKFTGAGKSLGFVTKGQMLRSIKTRAYWEQVRAVKLSSPSLTSREARRVLTVRKKALAGKKLTPTEAKILNEGIKKGVVYARKSRRFVSGIRHGDARRKSRPARRRK